MHQIVPSAELLKLVQEVATDLNLDESLRSYSGRHMYGASCLAVVGSLSDLVRFVVAVTRAVDEHEENDAYELYYEGVQLLDELLGETHQDNMGLDVVFYWPSVRVSECLQSPEHKEAS